MQVYVGVAKATRQPVAIKCLFKTPKKIKGSEGSIEETVKATAVSYEQELSIWRSLNHGNIIRLLHSFETDQAFFFVTELASGWPPLPISSEHSNIWLQSE